MVNKRFWLGMLVITSLILVFFLVSCASSERSNSDEFADLDNAISKATVDIISKIPPNTKIALFNISSNESVFTEYIIEELSVRLVGKAKLTVLDRRNLDIIRAEQQFQLSGEVSDNDIISIAHKSGASAVVSCSITGKGSLQRLRVRTLDVETGKVLSLTSHSIKAFPIVSSEKSEQNIKDEQFEKLQKNIDDTEKTLERIFDYETKIEMCLDVMESIENFTLKSRNQASITSALEIQSQWRNRTINYAKILDKLENDLEHKMQTRAIELSTVRHKNSNFEKISPISSDTKKSGNLIYITKTYEVLMRGNILGIIGNYDKVTVRGQIDMRKDTTEVIEAKIQ